MAKAEQTKDVTIPKAETATKLRELAGVLKGDLTKLAGKKADKAIGQWEALLEKVGPKVKGIHADLGKLREQVSAEEPDGKAIAKILKSLGTKTAKVAGEQTGVIGTALKGLAGALETGAASLTSGGKPAAGAKTAAGGKPAAGAKTTAKK